MHTVVVFHRDERERVDEALRALSTEGIDSDHVLVTEMGSPPPEQGPRSLFGLPHWVHYGGIGAAVGMLLGLAMRPAAGPLAAIWMVITGALLVGMLGAMIGAVVGGIARQRWRMRSPHPDLAVRVEAESRDLVERAREVLVAHGGLTHGGLTHGDLTHSGEAPQPA